MTHDPGNSADVRERLLAYARALGIECHDREIETILAGSAGLSAGLEQLRNQVAANFRGDFLAFRLWQAFQAQPADFRPPPLERGPFPAAQFGSYQPGEQRLSGA